MRSIITACLTAATIATLSVGTVAAQTIHGTVRDSTSHRPIAGVVLLLVDDGAKPLVRGLTDQRGQYRLPTTPAVRRLKVLHIGYRPRDITLSTAAADDATLDVTMAALPTLLDAVSVTSDASCSARKDRLMALSLLDQARAALLGSVVARDDRPAAEMLRLRYTTFIDAKSGHATRMRVIADSTTDTRVSFQAPHSASEFVNSGFVSDDHGVPVFDGPDAETLLDDAFRDGYCFELRDRDRARPNQVGLGFTAAGTRSGRVDIDGTLWVDTLARQIEEIHFDYRGLPSKQLAVHPGGSIHFRQLSNGTLLLDRWSFRLPTAQPETTYRATGPTVSTIVGVQEAGGVIAEARWSDGFRWEAPLDTAHLQLSGDPGVALAGRELALAETPYHGTADADGMVVIPRLLPGPYEGLLVDSTLAQIGIYLPAPFYFSVADSGSTKAPVRLPSVLQYVTSRCQDAKKPAPATADMLVIGRIADAASEPQEHVVWRLFEPPRDTLSPVSTDVAANPFGRNGDTRTPTATGETGADGLFAFCGAKLAAGDSLTVDTRPANRTSWHTTMIPVQHSLVVARVQAEAEKLLGVYDNGDGEWVAGATIRDTLGNEAQTSRLGVAPLTDLMPIAGYYMLEIRKPGYSPGFVRLRDDTTSQILTALAKNPLGNSSLPTTVVTAENRFVNDPGQQAGFIYRCGTGMISCIGRGDLDKKKTGNLDNFLEHVDGIVRNCTAAMVRPELAPTSPRGGPPPDVAPGAEASGGSCPLRMRELKNAASQTCIPNYVIDGFAWRQFGEDTQADLDQFLKSATIQGIEVYLPGHPTPKRFDPEPFSECGVIVIWTK
ncbi:MAG TPA: carboxypeptidase-like regulatory domain-containing protein [Gemmatimonadaceae bacterium]|jgi:hypothetical protein